VNSLRTHPTYNPVVGSTHWVSSLHFHLITPLVHCGLHRFLARSIHTSIHPPITGNPPPTPASHTSASPSVVFYCFTCDSTTPSSSINIYTLLSPQLRSRDSSIGTPIHSGCCVVWDSTNLYLSPPFLSQQWCRFALPPHDLWSGVDNELGASSASMNSMWSSPPLSALQAPSFPGADASKEIESSAPQGR